MKRTISGLLVFALLICLTPVPARAAAASTAGMANDGVNFTQLAKGNVYYGMAKHPLMLGGQPFMYYGEVTSREENATPVLWEVKGEEKDGGGQGDGKVTLLSKYIMDSRKFSESGGGNANDYTASSVSAWLNDRETGFLNGTFTAAEDSAIPLTEVRTANYRTNGTNDELTSDMGLSWPRSIQQKVYLPWGTYNGTRTALLPNVPEEPTTLYWSANPVQGKNQVAATTSRQGATLKGGSAKIFYWLRSPMSGNANSALTVMTGENAWVSNQAANNSAVNGVRPVIKLDPASVLYASEIKNRPANVSQTQASVPDLLEGEETSPNYKLTILGDDGSGTNPYHMSLLDVVPDSSIPVTMGETVTLQTNDPSHSGAGYSLNYKVVMPVHGQRRVIAYGQNDLVNPAGSHTELTIPTAEFLRTDAVTDTLDLYVWLQKNNVSTSNEASAPVHLQLLLSGGSPTVLPEPDPEPLDPETSRQINICYPDGKMKAALFNFDDSSDWNINSDQHLLEVLNKNGLKGTFNVITGDCDKNEAKVFSSRVSQYDGHELASHSVTHSHLDQIPEEQFEDELVNSKKYIEDLTGQRVTGLAYPYYYRADTAHLQKIKDAGYLYTRRTDPSNSFNLPDSFYNWNPTMWQLYTGPVAGATEPILPQKTDEFLALDPKGSMKLMFIWGHAADLDNWNNPEKSKWGYLEDHCRKISEHLSTVWNPTCREFVDYVNATKRLVISKGQGETVRFDNRANQQEVWIQLKGNPVKLEAAAVTEIDPASVKPAEPTPQPSASSQPTAVPTAEPTAAPDTTPKPNPPVVSGTAQVFTFQNDVIGEAPQGLSLNSTGGTSATVQKSPHDAPFEQIENYADYLVNAENTKNKVLKVVNGESKGTAVVEFPVGKVQDEFAADFKLLKTKNQKLQVDLVVGDTVQPLVGVDEYNNLYLMANSRNAARALNENFSVGMGFDEVWMPVGMVFDGLHGAAPKLDFYMAGRYNYTAPGSTPIASGMPTFEKASFDLAGMMTEMDLSQNAVIRFTVSNNGNAGEYLVLDDLRTYQPVVDIQQGYRFDFEDETVGLPAKAGGMETGGYWSRGSKNLDNGVVTNFRTTNIAYDMRVTEDPSDPANQVLRGKRGNGSNEEYYGALSRIMIQKPAEQLNIEFQIMLNGYQNNNQKQFNLFVQEGAYRGYFPDNETILAGTRLLSINNEGAVTGPEQMWVPQKVEENTWVKVKISYDIPTATYTLYLDDTECGTKVSTTLAQILQGESDILTLGFKHANVQTNQEVYLDNLVIGDPPVEPGPELVFYQDVECTIPLEALSGKVYTKLTREELISRDGGTLITAAYGADDRLLDIVTVQGPLTELVIPEGCVRLKAFVFVLDTASPLTKSVSYPAVH